ncbi:peptidoglycan-binding protein [Mesorhizobium sp. WSM3224]|uniref:peptidoglycan-binding domain-containing protein n=1 Tax=Mesorhizobium sp. WSM3224 TaxID=1040986 RepID=UPI000684843A|nr:peptidoglycan-binding protein [Mesorhizobium sp. WSM3224]
MATPRKLDPGAYLPGSLGTELNLAAPIGPGSAKKQVKWVQERLYLAGFGLRIDGDFGPATQQQLKNFQQAKGLQATSLYAQAEHDLLTLPFVDALNPIQAAGRTIGDLTVAVARQHVAQHPVEVGGPNSGPWVRMYMDGEEGPEWLWCAGFSFFMLQQACYLLNQPLPMKRSVSVDTVVDRAKASGTFLTEKESKTADGRARIDPGSFFLVRASSTHWSHMGIVSASGDATFKTCEGNSNDDGSSNGYEALERVRNYTGKDFVVWR